MKLKKSFVVHYTKLIERKNKVLEIFKNSNLQYEFIEDYDKDDFTDEIISKFYKGDQVIPKKIRYEHPHFNNLDEVDFYLKQMGYSIEYCLTDPCWDKVAIIGGEQVQYDISQQWTISKSIL